MHSFHRKRAHTGPLNGCIRKCLTYRDSVKEKSDNVKTGQWTASAEAAEGGLPFHSSVVVVCRRQIVKRKIASKTMGKKYPGVRCLFVLVSISNGLMVS